MLTVSTMYDPTCCIHRARGSSRAWSTPPTCTAPAATTSGAELEAAGVVPAEPRSQCGSARCTLGLGLPYPMHRVFASCLTRRYGCGFMGRFVYLVAERPAGDSSNPVALPPVCEVEVFVASGACVRVGVSGAACAGGALQCRWCRNGMAVIPGSLARFPVEGPGLQLPGPAQSPAAQPPTQPPTSSRPRLGVPSAYVQTPRGPWATCLP